MEYTVKPLTKELGQAFANYLSGLDFSYAPHWAGCFCRYYYLDGSMDEWRNRSAEQNREEAILEIENGNMNGYLAYEGERCIGWCCASSLDSLKRLKQELGSCLKEGNAGGVACFVIHPEYRGRGVARLLLKTAVEGFRAQGCSAVYAAPFALPSEPIKQYRGTHTMYEELGFEEIKRRDSISVMRLDLRAK